MAGLMKTNIREIGNSAGTILPALILKKLNLSKGDAIEVTEDGNRIILTPALTKPRYKLADLLKQCDENAPMSNSLKEWDEAQPVGRELL